MMISIISLPKDFGESSEFQPISFRCWLLCRCRRPVDLPDISHDIDDDTTHYSPFARSARRYTFAAGYIALRSARAADINTITLTLRASSSPNLIALFLCDACLLARNFSLRRAAIYTRALLHHYIIASCALFERYLIAASLTLITLKISLIRRHRCFSILRIITLFVFHYYFYALQLNSFKESPQSSLASRIAAARFSHTVRKFR